MRKIRVYGADLGKGSLVLRHVYGRLWKVHRPLEILVGVDKDVRRLIVPVGALTDLASVPWFLRWIMAVSGQWNRAAVIHDRLYSDHTYGYSRKEADEIFRQMMWLDGVRPFYCWGAYILVRIGGWRSYWS